MQLIHVHSPTPEPLVRALTARAPHQRVELVTTRAELAAALPEIEVLFAPLPPRDGWASAKKLRLVQLLGVGADSILPSPDLPADVEIATLRGVFAAEVSEHAFAMMLAHVRALPTLFARQRERAWVQFASGTLANKTLGVVGLGAIGTRVAALGRAFGMRVLGVRRRSGAAELDAVLAESDFVVVCVPKTPETTRLFDRARFARMKPGAFLVDVARGGVVDERALGEAIEAGHVAGAALDVFDEEPLPEASPLWSTPNTFITPHIAGWGLDYVGRAVDVLLENVARLERGEPRVALVDRRAGY